MVVRAKVNIFQEAMSKLLPPYLVQAVSLSDVFIHSQRPVVTRVSKFSSGPVDYSQTLHRTPWFFSGYSVFVEKTVFVFTTIVRLQHKKKIHYQERCDTFFLSFPSYRSLQMIMNMSIKILQ
jgi:hypothetical protein